MAATARRGLRRLAAASLLALACTACDVGPREAESGLDVTRESMLRRGLGAEPETLDPRRAADNAALAVVGDLYEGLTTETAGGLVVPGAAESWSVQDEGRTYLFRLRHGLRWSDGKPLDAVHFAAALDAARDSQSTAPYGALLRDIENVEAIDSTTLRIKLGRSVPYLPALLALPVAAPLHPAGAGQAGVPGNGAYRLVAWRPGEAIELERNPYYRDRGSVAFARVIHRPITDLGTELNLYRSGELDLTSEVPNARFEWIRENFPHELRVASLLSTYSYVVNLARLPDARARVALSMALDRERITDKITGAGERPAYGWIPEGIPGYRPSRYEWQAWPLAERLRRARSLWDASGAPGTTLTLCTDTSANHRRTAVALADIWKSTLAIEVRVVELEWSTYLVRRSDPGECDLVRLGWSADFVDPEAFAIVFESGSAQNTLRYSSERYDALLARSRLSTGDERMRLLAEAEAVLLDEAPVIPILFRVTKQLVKPYVTGYEPNPLGHVASRHLGRRPD